MTSKNDDKYIVDQGAKPVCRDKQAAVSTDHPIVTETIMKVLKEGGTAADAAIAGCMVQSAVQLTATNHTGTAAILYYDAASRETHQLVNLGRRPDDLPIFKTIPDGWGGWALPGIPAPHAAIPAFMPSMAALYDRFGTKPWDRLVKDAIYWAEEGHPVSSLEYGIHYWDLPFITYFPEGRDLFTPDGFLVPVGKRFRNPALAKTLKGLAADGPSYFIEGQWAQEFVNYANKLGWKIKLSDMSAYPPEWQAPLLFDHGDKTIAQYAPPEYQGVFCALVLGILSQLGYGDLEPGSADAIYYMANALRRARIETGYINDPDFFQVPVDQLLDREYHRSIANIIKGSRPKTDLTEHAIRTGGLSTLAAAGQPVDGQRGHKVPTCSCELSVVDKYGNWLQMMNTAQAGGIPGAVVGGVPMMGSHSQLGTLDTPLSTWLINGIRSRGAMGSTMILKDGVPVISLGTPGNCWCTVPQVLTNILDFGFDPPTAIDHPRMLPLENDYSLSIESRIAPNVVSDLTKKGLRVMPFPPYQWDMGSYQVCWRDTNTGLVNACVDPRRTGVADGI